MRRLSSTFGVALVVALATDDPLASFHRVGADLVVGGVLTSLAAPRLPRGTLAVAR